MEICLSCFKLNFSFPEGNLDRGMLEMSFKLKSQEFQLLLNLEPDTTSHRSVLHPANNIEKRRLICPKVKKPERFLTLQLREKLKQHGRMIKVSFR